MSSLKEKIYNILKIVDYSEFNNLIDKYNRLSDENTDFKTVIYKKNPNINSKDYMKKSNRSYIRQ